MSAKTTDTDGVEASNPTVQPPATAPGPDPTQSESQHAQSAATPPPTHGSGPDPLPHSSPDRRETLVGNSYADALNAREHVNLDRALPDISGRTGANSDRKALGLLACIVTLLVVMGYWMLTDNRSDPPHAVAQETVNIPDAPEHALVEPPMQEKPYAAAAIGVLANSEQARRPSLGDGAGEDTRAGEGPLHHEVSLLQRRIDASNGGTTGIANAPSREIPGFQLPPGAFGAAPAAKPSMSSMNNLAYTAEDLPDTSTAEALPHPDSVMLQGTLIRCVLQTRIITDIPGFTSCAVTEPVYSFTGKRLLLPKGSKVMGKYRMEPNGPRVAVIWDRIVTPGGVDVNMASPGIDDLGGAGHPGHYSAHWGQRITSALLISLLSDAFQYAAAEHGPRTTTVTNGLVTQSPFESNTAQTLRDVASDAVRRGADRPATVTINQGSILAIYVARDVDFTAVVARQ